MYESTVASSIREWKFKSQKFSFFTSPSYNPLTWVALGLVLDEHKKIYTNCDINCNKYSGKFA